ncbi:MAG: VOC family protein [Pseudobdellovibrionaceae bacterium]
MIKGINHITIAVRDLDRSFLFYRNVLGFKPLLKHSRGAYFLAGDLWFCLDLDASTRKEVLPEYTHFAFSVDSKHYLDIASKITSSGVRLWKKNVSEGDSLYFLDPDGYKLEVHVGDWKSRMKSIREKPWEENMHFFDV